MFRFRNLILLTALSSVTSSNRPADLTFRLTKSVRPQKYSISLHLDMNDDDPDYTGAIQIRMNVSENRKYIALHGTKFTIKTVRIYRSKRNKTEIGAQIKVKEWFSVEEFEQIVIVPYTDIPPGIYNLRMQFTNKINTNGYDGVYMSYPNSRRYMEEGVCVTQFEPADARTAFPCFDEPSFRAIFSIQISFRSNENLTALSNMPVKKIKKNYHMNGLTTTFFKPTPPMPTYIVAFVVGEYKAESKVIKNMKGKPLIVSFYQPRHMEGHFASAVDLACKCLEYLMDTLQVDFPLPKVDIVPISNFLPGAMENWGIITINDYIMTPENVDEEKWMLDVIAHEVSHSWFGNLVTIEWWNQHWIKEGFANFFAIKVIDYIHPELREMETFVVDMKYKAMALDSSRYSSPIIGVNINETSLIHSMFNVISNQKAASIIRMMEDFMGKERFCIGLIRYLKKFKYGSAGSDELFGVLQTMAEGINLTNVMETWTRQIGFPVVTMIRDGRAYNLSQKRHLLGEPNALQTSSHYGFKWDIPINYISDKNTRGRIWLHRDTENVKITLKKDEKWIKLNPDSIGYYVVNYDEETWKKFTEILMTDHETFNVVDRADLLNDVFTNAAAGNLPYRLAFDLSLYMKMETGYPPWYTMLKSMLYIADFLKEEKSVQRQLGNYIFDIMTNIKLWADLKTRVGKQDTFQQRLLTKYVNDAAWIIKQMKHSPNERFPNERRKDMTINKNWLFMDKVRSQKAKYWLDKNLKEVKDWLDEHGYK